MKKVFTVGVFDLLHKGHVLLFKRAKALGNYLIVAVQDSDSILKYKPDATVINSTDDRLLMVSSIRYVDEVVIYKDVDTIVPTIDFDILALGSDQNHNGFQRAIKWCHEHGKEVTTLSRTENVSSTVIKEQIRN